METYFVFIVKASCCLSLFYLLGLILFRNDNAFKLQRFYLLGSIILSLTLPFNHFSIDLFKQTESAIIQEQLRPEIQTESKIISEPRDAEIPTQFQPAQPIRNAYSLIAVFAVIYWVIVAAVLLRIFYSLIYIVVCFSRSERIKQGRYTIVFYSSFKGSFSFLRWIFINEETKHAGESQSIIKHEIVHANQYHSLDVIAIELLSAVMWFNPLIWLMRKGMQQLHEYLADEGVIRSGTNVLEYQALLVNQVAGDRLICLPSGFNQSLIKKRLVMMTKPSINQNKWYRLVALIPLAGFMFLILSFTNKREITAEKNVKSGPLTVYNQTKQKIKISDESTKRQESKPKVKRDSIKSSTSNQLVPPPPPPLKNKTPTSVKSPSGVVTAVAPTKMNVFYLGVDNPVRIAVSGVQADKIVPSITNGSIRKIGNNYIVNPEKLGMAVIDVSAEIDGKIVHAGNMEFRVKRVPDPVAKVAGSKGGVISRSTLLVQEILESNLENFDFDLRFDITEFAVVAENKGGKNLRYFSKSNKITDDQKSLIKGASAGSFIYFQNIKAVGPDGKIRELSPIAFTIQE